MTSLREDFPVHSCNEGVFTKVCDKSNIVIITSNKRNETEITEEMETKRLRFGIAEELNK